MKPIEESRGSRWTRVVTARIPDDLFAAISAFQKSLQATAAFTPISFSDAVRELILRGLATRN